MASSTKRLTHRNGSTVVVDAEKADRLVAGGNFEAAASKRSTSKSSDSE